MGISGSRSSDAQSFPGPVLLLSLLLMSASQAFLLFRKFHSCGFLAGFEESLYEVSELVSVLIFKLWSDGGKKNEEGVVPENHPLVILFSQAGYKADL